MSKRPTFSLTPRFWRSWGVRTLKRSMFYFFFTFFSLLYAFYAQVGFQKWFSLTLGVLSTIALVYTIVTDALITQIEKKMDDTYHAVRAKKSVKETKSVEHTNATPQGVVKRVGRMEEAKRRYLEGKG